LLKKKKFNIKKKKKDKQRNDLNRYPEQN